LSRIGAAALPDHAPEWLRGRAVYAFCGIGNPRSFEGTLAALRADVAKCRRFPDHHPYTEDDLCRIDAEAREFMAEVLVTTEKDAARLGDADLSMPLYTLRVELDVTRGEDDLEAVFAEILGKTSAPPREAVQPELPA
jgi:tetraacyldisaccharide 4'-kinase